MPYANVPENLWDKMDSCVKQVQDKDSSLDKSAAVAICYTSVVEGKNLALSLAQHYGLKAAYDWDQCVADQTEKYGDKATAEKVCGMIRAKFGKSLGVKSEPIILPDGFDLGAALESIETELNLPKMSKSAVKIGARNSRKDAADIQTAHDLMQRLGAKCDAGDVMQQMMGGKSLQEESLIVFGSEVKALGQGRIGGYLVRYSTSNDPDLTGDFFTKSTDFGGASSADVYYQHGMDHKIGKRTIGKADLKFDDIGAWAEAQLNMRDEYEKAIYQLAQAGKLGWSSGTAAHLVERRPAGKANEIVKWPLGLDASLTPTPAEPRNAAIPLKSYQPTMLDALDLPQAEQENRDEGIAHSAATDQTKLDNGADTMSDEALNEIKALLTAQAEKINTLETVIKSAPTISTIPAASGVTVVTDEADKPFKSIADNCAAVKTFEISKGQKVHARLTNPALKATGANEGIPDQGGFLLDPTLTTEFLAPTHEAGQFSAMVRRLPVSSNSNYGWINGVDETDRATGSRWGGIRGYRLAEGDTKTASKPKFRRINWELKKYAVLVYGTDELLQDASQFSVVVRQGVSEEIAFMLNDDIVNGGGAGGPFGFLQAPSLVSVTKETNQAAATIVFENLMKMWQRLLPASKRSAGTAWFINSEVSPQLDSLSLAAGTAALPPRFVDYGADGVMRIKGKPVYETEFNAALGTVGDIVLADMSQYLMWEKSGIQEATSIHVQFLTDETVFRFVYRCDGQPVLASAVTPYKGSATQSNFVVIETRS